MKRRAVLITAALGPLAATSTVPAAQAAAAGAVDGVAAAAPLPGVLSRPAQATPLATRSALLGATRAGQRLLLCGERGIVLWSDDQGQQWKQARVPVQVSLTAIAFADDRQGWASGHFGVLLHTGDGGESWTLAMEGATAARLQRQGATDEAQRRVAQRYVDEGPDKPFFDVALVQGRALAVGAYGLAVQGLPPADSAFSAFDGTRLPNPRHLHLYAACASGAQVYVAGEQGLLLRSSDGGGRFDAAPTPYKGSFFGLLLPAEDAVLAYGLRGNIWRSADRGDTWAQVTNPLTVNLGAGVVLKDGRTVLLAQNGDLLISSDTGQRFEHRPAAHPFPASALTVTADGRHAVLAGLRGLQRVAL